MLGKLIGVSLVALTQLGIWALAFVTLATIGTGFLRSRGFDEIPINLPLSFFVYLLLFFALGYFIYATLYVLVGSMVTTTQEGGQLAMPIIFMLMAGLYMAFPVMRSPNSSFAVWLSLVPFFSPIVMVVRIVSQTPPSTESTIKVLREGKEKTFKLKLAELPNRNMAANENGEPTKPGKDNESLEGVAVDDLDTGMRSQFKIPRTVEGAIVTDVDPDSKSYEAGLRSGDVILEIDHKPVRDAKDAVGLSEKAKGPDTLLRIWSRGNSRYLTVENGTNEPSTKEKENTDRKKPATPRR